MANIGVDLSNDQLVLTRGRDFRWSFQNLDDDGRTPIAFPAGDLYFELDTGGQQNALQQVLVTGASGGTYTFTYAGQTTAPINYYDLTSNPHGMDGDITDALEALSNVGAGNVYVHPASLVPVWVLHFTLNSGHNEIQHIFFRSAVNGGTFRLSCGANTTGNITYGASAATVQTALEGLASIGTGNCLVTAVSDGYQVEFIGSKANTNMPQIIGYGLGIGFALTGDILPNKIQTSTLIGGTSKLSEELVNTLNSTINDFFNGFETLLGVDIDFYVTDELNVTFTVTSKRTYQEAALITFAVNVASTDIKSFLNGVSAFLGVIDTISVDFYWNHTYQVEFVGSLGLKPQPALVPGVGSLTGGGNQAVEVTVLQPGKERYDKWDFTVSGDTASIEVQNEVADTIPSRTPWQLVFLPSGETAGGDPQALGLVKVNPRQ